ncbi:MAG: hypothetical protein AMXMBFR66_04350 [Pseudomonadota bacterium]|nr:hypothetical protein [Rubrivivax sp.]NLZ42438.1 hypothetical protein [Comamonadaceae bacterium]
MSTYKATPEETRAIFGNGLVLFGVKPPQRSRPNSPSEAPSVSQETTPQAPPVLDLQNLPFDPAVVTDQQTQEAHRKRTGEA